ncbi:hypothetical protein H4Q26_002781 [Puccinia striiformis f. sp. tritici PST-130]|nr:hypothetical protein H4Q26_002781 [Puccinia striiformis f. sp. tritici PST-130]
MARGRKRLRRSSGPVEDPESNEEDEEGQSTAPSTQTPAEAETTDQERLEHALDLARKKGSSAYASYNPPELSEQRDKFRRRMIAWQCKICLKYMNRPAYDTSCGNLLAHADRCLVKQKKKAENRTLACVGVSGTGDLDPRQVLQRCALWCAETASPFSALQQPSHQSILHPTVVKNLPTRKMVSKAIHLLYSAVQEEFCQELKTHVGAMYLGVDAWQAPNGFDIIGASSID